MLIISNRLSMSSSHSCFEYLSPDLRSACQIFRIASTQLQNYQLELNGYVRGGRINWYHQLWIYLCGARSVTDIQCIPSRKPRIKNRKSKADEELDITNISNYIINAMCLRDKIAHIAQERPPTWEECDNIAELFVYGVLVWSYYACSNLDRLVVLIETKEFIFNWLICSETAQATIEAAALQPIKVNDLLEELVSNESLLTSSRLQLPTRRGIYDEQKELALFVQKWVCQREPYVICYEAPPDSGKTTSAAFIASFLSKCPNNNYNSFQPPYIIYACHVSYVREHLRLHVESCGVPFIHVYAEETIGNNNEVWVYVGKGDLKRVTIDVLRNNMKHWELSSARPMVIICDIESAKLVCGLCPHDILFFDEVSTSSFNEKTRSELIEASPRLLILLSSFLPSRDHIQNYIDIQSKKWNDVSVMFIRSRRIQASITGFVDDSVILPHHFGVNVKLIRQLPHLLRFYSATALKSILEEEKLEVCVALEGVDLSSTKRIRQKSLQLIEEGKVRSTRALVSIDGASPQSALWNTITYYKSNDSGVSLVYATDVLDFLNKGRSQWINYADIEVPHIDHLPEIVESAMQKGVAILSDEDCASMKKAYAEYKAWVHLCTVHRNLSCVVANTSAIHGVHGYFSRLFFWDEPASFEEAAHICGRVGRGKQLSNFKVFFRNNHVAAKTMVPCVLP